MGTDLFIFKGIFKGAGADMFGYVCIKHIHIKYIGPGTFKNSPTKFDQPQSSKSGLQGRR